MDEEDEVQIEEPDLGIIDTYQLLWKIIRLPLMPMMLAILLTGKMGFSAADNVTSLKLVEQGETELLVYIKLEILIEFILFQACQKITSPCFQSR